MKPQRSKENLIQIRADNTASLTLTFSQFCLHVEIHRGISQRTYGEITIHAAAGEHWTITGLHPTTWLYSCLCWSFEKLHIWERCILYSHNSTTYCKLCHKHTRNLTQNVSRRRAAVRTRAKSVLIVASKRVRAAWTGIEKEARFEILLQ